MAPYTAGNSHEPAKRRVRQTIAINLVRNEDIVEEDRHFVLDV